MEPDQNSDDDRHQLRNLTKSFPTLLSYASGEASLGPVQPVCRKPEPFLRDTFHPSASIPIASPVPFGRDAEIPTMRSDSSGHSGLMQLSRAPAPMNTRSVSWNHSTVSVRARETTRATSSSSSRYTTPSGSAPVPAQSAAHPAPAPRHRESPPAGLAPRRLVLPKARSMKNSVLDRKSVV